MATMPTTLRLRWTGKASEHLLLNVTHRGPGDLDLKLIGTDFDKLYVAKLKDSSVKSLQASNFTGNLDEWKSVLRYVLHHHRPNGPLPDSLRGIEAVGAVSGSTLTVTIQRKIDDITQRLGTIKLEETDTEEVNTLEWTDNAVAASDDLRSQLNALQASAASQQNQIARLTNELDNLVKAKKEHEDELLSKFAALLNAKKLKIRDQQRLLAGAQVNPDTAQEVSTARSGNSSRKAGASRGGKRKANGAPEPTQDENAEDNDDDQEADLGTTNGEDEEEERRRQETPETDDEDVAEDELDAASGSAGTAPQPDDSQTTRRVAVRQSQRPDSSQSSKSVPTRLSQRNSQHMDVDETPARHTRGKEAAAKQPTLPPTSTANLEDDDDETEDEL